MNTYLVRFRTDAGYYVHDIEAETPEHALEIACELDRYDFEDFDYTPWDDKPVNEICVLDEHYSTLASWQDCEYRLREAAYNLLICARRVLAWRDSADLPEALAQLDKAVAKAGDDA